VIKRPSIEKVDKIMEKIETEEDERELEEKLKKWYQMTRDFMAKYSNKMATVELAKFYDVINLEKFVEETLVLSWEMIIMALYIREKTLETEEIGNIIKDGKDNRWSYNRYFNSWELEDIPEDVYKNDEVLSVIGLETIEQMIRRVMKTVISELESDENYMHYYPIEG